MFRLGGAAAVIALALLAACSSYDSDIAGARGHVDWSAGKAAAYNNDDIVEVVATIDKPAATGASHKIELHFIHNRQTQKVALDNVFVDGKSQGLLGGSLNLLLLQLQ